MKVLFLTLSGFDSLSERGIYTDLLREFTRRGHEVYAVSPVEKRMEGGTRLIEESFGLGRARILRLRVGETQKTGIIRKGLSTVMMGSLFKRAIRKYFSGVRFDLILYSTPPITLLNAIKYVKKRTGAKTYLLLKDIFPQNAVDIGMLSAGGVRGLLFRHFRRQERELYRISDRIGCMSPANAKYVVEHNADLNLESRVEVCPNSIEVSDAVRDDAETRKVLREKFGLPEKRKIFVYGGNLGRPQCVSFIVECLRAAAKEPEIMEKGFFVIAGSGTDASLLSEYIEKENPRHVKLFPMLPKDEFDSLVRAADVGLVFLDHRFTIPNFPSRLLSYMQAGLPVLAATDPNTDIGRIAEEGGFGWSVPSDNAAKFSEKIISLLSIDLRRFGDNAFQYLKDNWSVEKAYGIIMRSTGGEEEMR